jgi:hypothetical protein
MGGHISVGVRRIDGSFRTIGVWTNPLGHFLRERAFRDYGSLEPLDRFFARYLKDDADFGGPQETVPGEYGFVLIDAVTKTITNMNSYSSMQWVNENDLGYVSSGRMFASEDAFAEMAEMRESAVRARYVIPGSGEYTYEDLPPFTTHEGMFALMKDLSRRGVDAVIAREVGEAIAECDSAIAAIQTRIDAGEDDAAADEEVDHKVEDVERALERLRREVRHHHVFVQYCIAFPAWTIVDLWPETEEDFLKMQAAVESCVTLTEDERAAWQEDYDYRFGSDEDGVDDDVLDENDVAVLSENLDIVSSDEKGGN